MSCSFPVVDRTILGGWEDHHYADWQLPLQARRAVSFSLSAGLPGKEESQSVADTHPYTLSEFVVSRGSHRVSSHLGLLLGKRAVKPEIVWLGLGLRPVVFQVIIAVNITATRAAWDLPCVGAEGHGGVADVALVLDFVVEWLLLVRKRLEVLYALVDVGLEVKVLAVALVVVATTGTFDALRVLVIVAESKLRFLNVTLGAVEIIVNLLDVGGSRRIVERTIQLNSLESIDRIVKVTSIW